MKVFQDLSELPVFEKLVLTQGTFDGVHQGHIKVLESVVQLAKQRNAPSMLLTFYPHPRLVVNPDDNALRMLNSIAEKEQLIAKTGLDYMLVLPFTSTIAKYSATDFVQEILVNKLQVSDMVIGYDHHFGHQRLGNINLLSEMGEKLGFAVQEIAANEIDSIAISSTRIRKSLLNGDLEEANQLLGYPYSICGTVVHGQKLGRQLGFPTANLHPEDPYKLIPASGVYAGFAYVGHQRWMAAINIGFKPTVGEFGMNIEAYLLNFSDSIYGSPIKIELIRRIRPELKFASLDELKQNIQKDVHLTREVLSVL